MRGAGGSGNSAAGKLPESDWNRAVRRLLRPILALIVLAAMAWYVWSARATLKSVLHFKLAYAPAMLAVPLASLAVNGYIGRLLVAEFGVRLTFTEWYGLALVNALGNYLPLPQGGAMARGVYLKRVHGLPYLTYAATLLVTYASALALAGFLGLAGLVVLTAKGRVIAWPLWVAFGVLASAAVLFTPLIRFIPLPGRARKFQDGLTTLRRHHLLRTIMALQCVQFSLTATGLWLAIRALPMPDNHHVTWLTALMMGLMSAASGVINVTPGNVGVEQGAVEVTARMLHLKLRPSYGFAASCLFRAMAVVVVFVLAPAYSAVLSRRKSVEGGGTSAGGGEAVQPSTPGAAAAADVGSRV